MLLTVSEAAKRLGVTTKTLRNWEADGAVEAIRTPGGHRRYEESFLDLLAGKVRSNEIRKTVLYCRCSTEKQRENLDRQKLRLMEHAHNKNYDFIVLEEIASGVNESRRQLNRLLDMILKNQVCRLVIEWKDRLARFGYSYIKKICDAHNVEIEILNNKDNEAYEQEITEDIIAIMTAYSARIYGKRGGRRKKK